MLSNVIKNGSSKITEKTLEALGFVNVPKGEWEYRSTSKGYTYSKSANTIPLIKNKISNVVSVKSASGNTLYTNDLKINSKLAVQGRCVVGNATTIWEYGAYVYNVYLPYFYNLDVSKLQKLSDTDILAWYEKVGGGN